jgi:transcriptional regulator with XRE-family HTH domain
MARPGQTLREAREEKGYSWQEIEEATGIWREYILALEEENYQKFTTLAHFRSCLRLYARYLGLDVEEVFVLWEEELTGRSRSKGTAPAVSAGFPYPTLLRTLTASLVFMLLAVVGVYGYQQLRDYTTADKTLATTNPEGMPILPSPTSTPELNPYLPIASTASPRYIITATLDYQGHGLAVQERIDYANNTGQRLRDIVLNVFPNHDAGIFSLDSLTLEFGTGPVTTTYSLQGMTLRAPLTQDLAPEQVVTLLLDYTLNLPYIDPAADFSEGSLGWSQKALDVGHWYPALAPYLPQEGWCTFPYHPVGDSYVMDVADYEVQIQAPAGVTVVGSGSEERYGDIWQYSISEARSFAFAASDQYLSYSTEINGTTITSYYFPEHEGVGVDVAEFAAEALAEYSALFAVPYPYADYRVAETEFAGGMEFSGLSFLGALWYDTYPESVRSQLVYLLAHEVSHQWWYGLVGNDQVREPWLDEALATFSGLLFYRSRYPDDHLWAWEFVVFNWQPTGRVNASTYVFADQASYMNAVYRRGAVFLADLRHAMGSSDFQVFLQDYCQSQSYKLSTTEEFFSILSRHTDEDLSPLLEEYFTQEEGTGES